MKLGSNDAGGDASLGTSSHGVTVRETEEVADVRLLLIDDDEDDCIIIRDLLHATRHVHYDFSWESTWDRGREALLRGEHDVCLLDYQLDEGTGIDLLQDVTQEGCTTPIVILTGYGDEALDIAAIRAGAADYLMKEGLASEELERTLRHAIERAASWRSTRQAVANQRAMMTGIPDTVFRVSRDRRILDFSAGIVGESAEWSVDGDSTLASTFGAGVGDVLAQCLERAMASGETHSCEFTREGTINLHFFEARFIPVEEANEAVVIVRDFTDERAGERRLEDLAQAKDRFLSRISHDLRTPLTTVLGYTDLLDTEWAQFTSAERREMITAIGRGAATLGHLFEDALVMARHEIHSLVLAPTRVDLAQHAAKATAAFGGDGEVEADVTAGVVFAEVDPLRLDQILRNLVSNAVLHGGPHATVVTGVTAGSSWIEVRDDGTAIPEEERSGIFNASDRSLTILNNSVSAGVGLTVSLRLATLMGGDLTYRYDRGWNKFRLQFPSAPCQSSEKSRKAVGVLGDHVETASSAGRVRGARGEAR